jgi:hypothetical protein
MDMVWMTDWIERDRKDWEMGVEREGRASIPGPESEATGSPGLTQRTQKDMRTKRCNDIVEFGGSITWRSTPADRTRTRAEKLGKRRKYSQFIAR